MMYKQKAGRLMLALCLGTLAACGRPADDPSQAPESPQAPNPPPAHGETVPDYWPRIRPDVQYDPAIEGRVEEMLAAMTLEQKVAQLIQPEIRDFDVEDMRRYGFGSYLNGGGAFPNDDKHAPVQAWVDLAERLYQASVDDSLDGSTIPTMWGTDAVHGHNNVIGATVFPHNIGLGAADNPELVEQIGAATAREVAATGIDWVFAPTVAVARDDRWGRTYEAYSEDPRIVRDLAYALVEGLQGRGDDLLSARKVLSTAKHYIGDGGTIGGDDQGNNPASERQLFEIHAPGYVSALTAGAQTVMASFSSWQGEKVHGSQYLLTDVLKERMGFDGFVIGDWNGHGQIPGCRNDSCPMALNAGLDVFMVPTDAWKPLLENTIGQVESGIIPRARLDDAVSRVLRVKLRAGLFEKPAPARRPLSGKEDLIGHPEHRQIARQAVRESLVLLKNRGQLLPLKPAQHVGVAGDGADHIGKQSGGWTITWQGTGNENVEFPGGTSIYGGIRQVVEAAGGQAELSVSGDFERKPDAAIVVFGEEPYAEGNGDLANLEYQRGNKRDLALLRELQERGIPVVSVFLSGRPLWVNPELNASDAFVAAWLPGSEGQGVADVLFTDTDGQIRYDFKGRLPFSWPASPQQTAVNIGDEDYQPLLPFGFGLRYGDEDVLGDDLDERSSDEDFELTPLVLLENSIRAPWTMSIGSVAQQTTVRSSVAESGPVRMRTMDRFVQEDARSIRFDGSEPGQIRIGAPFPQDLRSYLERDGALVMDVRVQPPIEGEIGLSMDCGPDCRVGVEVTQYLRALPADEWHELSVDLDCFGTAQNLAGVYYPLILTSTGEAALSLSRIYIKPDMGEPLIRCKD